ncbi:MAG: squalene/phytoene synthase family protein [Phycisphaeraceae bacterium]|nr:MAG: squalene/phytoene synthase family protein [Phycisphaeraceae bacterium]
MTSSTAVSTPRVGATPRIEGRELTRAYDACRAITRSRARNFYYGLKLTPEPKRSAIYSIYAWMRLGDDLADADADESIRREGLSQFRGRTQRILDGDRPDPEQEPVWSAFHHTLDAFKVDHADIRDMMDGLEEDLDHTGYDTAEELERYCGRVASTVGRVCVTIWGLRPGADPERALEMAVRRGHAFQLTNILRDYSEDYDGERVYLPRESFERHGVTPEDVRRWSKPRECREFVREWLRVARNHYNASEGLEGRIDAACAPAMWAMTRIYSGILEKIERHPERVAQDERIRLQSFHKAGIALRAVIMSRRDGW